MLHKDSSVEKKIEEERRFVGYISSLLHYNAINFDKKNRKYNERFALILDDIDNQSQASLVEKEYITESSYEELENQISDPHLYTLFMSLTTRERQILNLSIINELKDKQIASLLQVSQQSISKTKKVALKKLRNKFNK